MLLDPFTIAAQIVNFLLLLWLLRRVLYGPVTRAMLAREARVRAELDDARRQRAEAERERAQHEEELAAFTAGQEARMGVARAEVEQWRHAQMEAARLEVDARRERWQGALAQEQQAVVREVRRRVGHEILVLTRQALRDLAGSALEDRIIARFLERLHELPASARDRLATAAHEDGARVHLRTACPLVDEERARLSEAVSDALGGRLAASFETTPDLGSGVEMRAGGLTVAWSLNEYLASLEERLGAAFGDDLRVDDGGHG
ncbi:MAG: F0F1 ATP synthase subunit delta [Acidobacteria bacterium]|nr:F0F1 ATP synthase subunit delta [Acidobacteriota bacterium]